MMRGMVIDMNDRQLLTLAQLRSFLNGTVALDFAVAAEERYAFIARTVRRFSYARLKRADKSVVLRFLARVSGYSRQHLTRRVQRVRAQGPLVKRYRASRTSFARTFTPADVLLLAHTDTLHGTLSGPATKKLMERAYAVFREPDYERLATISVAHLYNPLMMTPYENLKSLPNAQQFLKPGITFQQLDARASAMSDNEAAQRLNGARAILFKTIFNRSESAA